MNAGNNVTKINNKKDLPNWDDYYLEGAKILKEHNPFHIDVTISGKKRNNRRALNLDIYTDPGTPPLKLISHMVPYPRKYEVFSNLSDTQLKWSKWAIIKQQYALHQEDDVQYGKCQTRTKHTKVLSRYTIPHCAAGMYLQDECIVAHVLLFDKEYRITCHYDNLTGKGTEFYMARGFHTESLNPPELDLGL